MFLSYFQLVLVKAYVTRVSLMNFCGKQSVHHPPYQSHLLNIIAYCVNLTCFVTLFLSSCRTNYIPAVQVLYRQWALFLTRVHVLF